MQMDLSQRGHNHKGAGHTESINHPDIESAADVAGFQLFRLKADFGKKPIN